MIHHRNKIAVSPQHTNYGKSGGRRKSLSPKFSDFASPSSSVDSPSNHKRSSKSSVRRDFGIPDDAFLIKHYARPGGKTRTLNILNKQKLSNQELDELFLTDEESKDEA